MVEPMVPFSKYDALVQLVAQMKREGFAMPSESVHVTVQPELPKGVLHAIGEIAEPQSQLHRQLVNSAWGMLQTGMSEADVVARILTGESVDL